MTSQILRTLRGWLTAAWAFYTGPGHPCRVHLEPLTFEIHADTSALEAALARVRAALDDITERVEVLGMLDGTSTARAMPSCGPESDAIG